MRRGARSWVGACVVAVLWPGSPLSAQAPRPSQVEGLEKRISQAEAWVDRNPGDASAWLGLATLERQAGDTHRAEGILQAGLEATGSDELRWALVELHWADQRWSDALEALDGLDAGPRTDEARATLLLNLGISKSRRGAAGEAEAHWREALALRPTLTEASLSLALRLLRTDRHDEARAVADAGLEHAPDEPRLLAVRAGTLEGPEANRAAERALRALRAQDLADEDVALRLTDLLLSQNRVDEVRALHDTLLAAPDPGLAVYREAAGLWLAVEQPDSALRVLEPGEERHGLRGEYWTARAKVHEAAGGFEDAARAYDRAADLLADPTGAELARVEAARSARSDALLREGVRRMLERPAPLVARLELAARLAAADEGALADRVYAALLRERPEDVRVLVAAGDRAAATGDTARARDRYEVAARGATPAARALLGLVRVAPPSGTEARRALLRRTATAAVEELRAAEAGEMARAEARAEASGDAGVGRVGSSESSWERAREDRLRDGRREAVDGVLTLLTQEGAWGRAELDRLQRWYPDSRQLLRHRARMAAATDAGGTAVPMYDRLLQDRPEEAGLHRERAAVLEGEGRTVDAMESWARALELEPESEEPFRALLRLHRQEGTLSSLLERVRRLRLRREDSEVLREREIELLQRMGRLAEARAVAREGGERP